MPLAIAQRLESGTLSGQSATDPLSLCTYRDLRVSALTILICQLLPVNISLPKILRKLTILDISLNKTQYVRQFGVSEFSYTWRCV
eukprot:3702100-Amphidinium_carterae.1